MIIIIKIIIVKIRCMCSLVFFKKAVLERFTVSIGTDLCQSLFSYKVEVVRPAILFFKKRLRYRYFLFTFSIIFQKSFFTEHLRTKALKKRPQLLNLWKKKISRNLWQFRIFVCYYSSSKWGGTRRFPWRNRNDENNWLS